MTTTPIVLLAPSPGMTFVAMPSGATYVADQNGLVKVASGAVADQLALIAAGCATLEPNAGGVVATQTGTTYTVAPGDENNAVVFSSASPVTVTLPATAPGFAVSLYQGGAGQVTTVAAGGASIATPNAATTQAQYSFLSCLVIANTTGANAQWNAVAQPTSSGGGTIGASTLAGLYAQDTAAHYAQWTIAQIFADGTPANDGTWLKTGTGNGAGNWTQQATVTLASLNAAIGVETSRAEAAELSWHPLWADESYGLLAITDPNGNLIYGEGTSGTDWPPPVLVNADRSALNFLEFIQGGILWADENYGTPFTDSNGNVILGLRRNGSVDIPQLNVTTSALTATDAAAMAFYEATYTRMWDEVYGIAITDGNGNVLFGIEHNGSVDIPAFNVTPTGWIAVINPADGGIWAGNGSAQFKIAAPQGAAALPAAPLLGGDIVQWLDTNVTPWESREYSFVGGIGLPSATTAMLHVLQYGESTSVGANGGVGGLLTTSPVAPTQAFMFSPDHRTVLYPGYTAQADEGTKAFDAQQLSFTPLQEKIAAGQTYWGESHGSGLAYSIINIGLLATTSVTLHSSHGCSQEVVFRLGRGTQLYKNLERGVERAFALCKQGGIAYSIPGISYVQGINDYATSEPTWNAAVVTLQSNLTADLNAITGASAQIPLFIVQYACWTCPMFGGGGQAAAPAQCQGMIDLYKANTSTIILVGNSYHLNYFGASGAVHMLAQGYRMQGEEIGRAQSEAITGGVASVTPPLFATACTASHGSSTLTVTFNNTTQLQIDTSIVTDPGQYGLRLTDSGGSPIALSSIAVVGTGANAQITATTATALSIGGTYNLGIANFGTAGASAGPTTGPRSCIRDSAPESYSMGGRMYRYACTQSIAVTVDA